MFDYTSKKLKLNEPKHLTALNFLKVSIKSILKWNYENIVKYDTHYQGIPKYNEWISRQ